MNGSTSVKIAEATRTKVFQVADELGYKRKVSPMPSVDQKK
uniref:Uncharacterized protein n=1 Tax=Vibrio tasmaniensis TaxID=212663 RepID=A0A0H3ZQL9_9VIBR|nr:hypothetical protein [Vibrio tasmaniensis]